MRFCQTAYSASMALKKLKLKPKLHTNKSEYLSKDILDAGFIQVFRPFLLLQTLMGSSRVDARDQFVTPVSVGQKIYSVICSFVTVSINHSSAYWILNQFSSNHKIYYLVLCAMVMNALVYFCNITHVRYCNTEGNVNMYVNMQQLDRNMGVSHNAELNNMMYKLNLKTVISLTTATCTFCFASFAGGVPYGLGFVGLTWTSCPFLLEISYCCNLVMYYVLRLRFINAVLINHIKPFNGEEDEGFLRYSDVPQKHVMQRIAAKHHSFQSNDLHAYIKQIVTCYNEFAGLHRFQVLMFFINYILFILFGVEFGITGLKTKMINYQQWTASVIFLVIGLFISLLLCIRCELFLKEIKRTKRLSIAIMSRHIDGPLREKAKKIIMIIEQTPPRFSVYDMWDMDARKLLKMFSLVTSLLVTQLQFAFL